MFATARRAFTMSSTVSSAPFSRAVVNAMKNIYPEELADRSWDNTGTLIEAPFNPSNRQSNTAFLAIDLTQAVADEAIARKSSIVIAYHPIIFRGLKSLTLKNTQQTTLLRLIQHGISVYSPHTAIDSAPGGLGDWLADIVTRPTSGETEKTSGQAQTQTPASQDTDTPSSSSRKRPTYTLTHHPSSHGPHARSSLPKPSQTPTLVAHTRRPIIPQSPPLESHPGAGMGRIVNFSDPQPLPLLLDRIGAGLNNPKCFPIAIPQGSNISDLVIRSVGICAGSGASMLADADVDLWFTGEVGHHEALAAIEKGKVVVQVFHSNSERGYLKEVMKGKLEEELVREGQRMAEEGIDGVDEGYQGVWKETAEGLQNEKFEVVASEVDRDPFGILVLKE